MKVVFLETQRLMTCLRSLLGLERRMLWDWSKQPKEIIKYFLEIRIEIESISVKLFISKQFVRAGSTIFPLKSQVELNWALFTGKLDIEEKVKSNIHVGWQPLRLIQLMRAN